MWIAERKKNIYIEKNLLFLLLSPRHFPTTFFFVFFSSLSILFIYLFHLSSLLFFVFFFFIPYRLRSIFVPKREKQIQIWFKKKKLWFRTNSKHANNHFIRPYEWWIEYDWPKYKNRIMKPRNNAIETRIIDEIRHWWILLVSFSGQDGQEASDEVIFGNALKH